MSTTQRLKCSPRRSTFHQPWPSQRGYTALSSAQIDGSSLHILARFTDLKQLEIQSEEFQQVRIADMPNLVRISLQGKLRQDGYLVVDNLPALS